SGFLKDIGDLDRLLSRHRASERADRIRTDYWVTAPLFSISGRCPMQCNGAKRVPFGSIHDTEFCFADVGRVRQHGVEHGREVAARPGDDARPLGGGRLLLQRLGELLFQVGVGCAKAVNMSSRLRCLRTKTGNVCSALCPFASQGHLVGTVTGPPSGRPSQGSSLSILTAPHDELAALHLRGHSITSSARASTFDGTVIPSALAVVRLITSSNLVGCSTGNSAGFAPLRILPA